MMSIFLVVKCELSIIQEKENVKVNKTKAKVTLAVSADEYEI
jgi:hypothetical protein